jgi:hypothetical protein
MVPFLRTQVTTGEQHPLLSFRVIVPVDGPGHLRSSRNTAQNGMEGVPVNFYLGTYSIC